MYIVTLAHEADFDGWRTAARGLAAANVPADEIIWEVGGAPEPGEVAAAEKGPALSVPRTFIDLARAVVCHAADDRFARLYAMLLDFRAGAAPGEGDPALRELQAMAHAVQHEMHDMRRSLGFEAVSDGPRLVAWHAPRHYLLRANAGFFARQTPAIHWSILTPGASLHRDNGRLAIGPGADPRDGLIATIWASYCAAPDKRLKPLGDLPEDAWKDPPPAAAPDSAETPTLGNSGAALAAIRDEAKACRRCALWKPATQTVFGEGPADAQLMFVGEQPGDQEDLAGRPFVGPAGQLFDRALAVAGIDRTRSYVTNAVKHFKFEPRGKRRIHAKPRTPEIEACHWWIDQERMILKPTVTVALGATAARALLGRVVTIGRSRGQPFTLPDGGECWITVHPSYLLRIDDRDRAEAEFDAFVADLKQAKARLDR
jgi:DNA polymerase